MNDEKFWAKVNHEHDVKACEGKTIAWNSKGRARGYPGGWKPEQQIVTVIFVHGENMVVSRNPVSDKSNWFIVKTFELMVL